MKYWWVNHKQTVTQEIEGQYLWSPKTESNGARSEFYKNMRRASPGDFILSYANAKIAYVGRVVDFAFTATKPEEFGAAGLNWSNEGWLLPVYWVPLSVAVEPKKAIAKLSLLLPEKYSPINAMTGGGNQKAYLAEVSKAVFDLMAAGVDYDIERLHKGGSNSLTFEVVNEILDSRLERFIQNDNSLDATTKISVISARRGQGKFRENVEQVEAQCRLTGITTRNLLIASHIKPWRSCETSTERLDGHNGLLLTPDADHLFDRGFISFDDVGKTLVSSRVSNDDLRRLGFDQMQSGFGFSEPFVKWGVGVFNSSQQKYLKFHRTEVFLSS